MTTSAYKLQPFAPVQHNTLHPEVFMSIKIESIGSPTPPRPAVDKKTSNGFEDRLQNVLAEQSPQALAARQARMRMHMCQLELARSLFDESENTELSAMLEALPMARGAGLSGLADRQIFDSSPPSGSALTGTHPPVPTTGQGQAPEVEQIISQAAADHGVAPGLIRSVIRTESAFNPRAVSPVGAQGLMQLMPGTAADLGVTDPFDPEQNIMAGTRYLRQLLDRYNGDLDHALAAYNWGMGNVDRYGLDRLPEETRNYLVRVKQA
jgi:soluble lytic murein transglycosylase-like protein